MTRRALVLGAGGFLGSHLCRHLVRSGWSVRGVVRDPDAPHVRVRLADLLGEIQLIAGDAGDEALLRATVPGSTAVFPFAGLSGAAASMHRPLADLAANAAAQLELLEVIRAHDRDVRVVFPGSRLQYGRVAGLPVTEDARQEPLSVYGAHKALAERYHLVYARTYGIGTCSLRISNPYGPGQDRADAAFGVVGTFLARASRGEDLQVYGGGGQLRDYVYVSDLVDLVERAATDSRAVGEAFNASGPQPTSLREMAETVVATVGRGRVVDAAWPATDAIVETGDYGGSTGKASLLLGWRPTTALTTGLAHTWSDLSPTLVASA